MGRSGNKGVPALVGWRLGGRSRGTKRAAECVPKVGLGLWSQRSCRCAKTTSESVPEARLCQLLCCGRGGWWGTESRAEAIRLRLWLCCERGTEGGAEALTKPWLRRRRMRRRVLWCGEGAPKRIGCLTQLCRWWRGSGRRRCAPSACAGKVQKGDLAHWSVYGGFHPAEDILACEPLSGDAIDGGEGHTRLQPKRLGLRAGHHFADDHLETARWAWLGARAVNLLERYAHRRALFEAEHELTGLGC